MRLLLAGVVVGVGAALAVLVGLAMLAYVDDVEQGWENEHYHQYPTADPPEAHREDGPP